MIYTVDIPEVKGKITFRSKRNVRYVYYECNRNYDPVKKYTTVKRVTISKVSDDDETKMRPNENFRKYFPEVELPEERGTLGMKRETAGNGSTFLMIQQTRNMKPEISVW